MSDGDTAKKAPFPPADTHQVAQFLISQPDFLLHHPQLLEALELPHATGEAVSLIKRQVSVLRERNRDLRRRLHQLLESARRNELLLEKSQRLVLALLEAEDLFGLVKVLSRTLDRDFAVPYHRLVLFGTGPSFPAAELAEYHCGALAAGETGERIRRLLLGNRPFCGILRTEELSSLFGDHAARIGSVAAAPLGREEIIGVLALGHADPDHYGSGTGTLFLRHIADVLNRTLPRLLPANPADRAG